MKILHLEDNPEDAQLIGELLRDEWSNCNIRVVKNGADFETAVRGNGFDVILSDFTMEHFNGLEALRIAREVTPATPFIFLSGTIGEERAIEAVRAGARDYILKDRIKRLITAVHQALRDKQEIHDRVSAEAAHRRFVAILEHTPDFVGLTALSGHVFYVNRAGMRMIGLSETQDPGVLSMRDFHPTDINALMPERLGIAMREGTWSGESVLAGGDGSRVPVSQVIIAHKNAAGEAEYFSTVMRDITAAKEAERRIREQADLLNKATDAIIVRDLGGKITFWNQGAERIFGWTAEEALGRHQDEFFKPGSAGQNPFGEEDWQGDVPAQHKTGKHIVMDVSVTVIRDSAGAPTSYLSIGTDITARRQLEEQFLRAQRMESIGMLAAGIAHDLNNVLAPILMGAPILRERVTDAADVKMLTSLEKSAERGAALVRQILGFAQGVSGIPQLVQVKHIIRDVASVIRETFPKAIAFEDNFAPNLWPIHANPTHINQVLLNLCLNARDSMPQGGKLRLEARNYTLDERAALAIAGARPGNFLQIEVEDTGTGIPPEIVARIWEPFFTTKETGKGTGLGLSTVRGIVENHDGFITVQTAAGRGTTFTVHFPAADGPSDDRTAGTGTPFIIRGNGELILVVDDESSVREVTAAILSHHGYRVLLASDGTEAVALFAPRQNEISLVITDLNMPQLGGAAVANVVHRINPATKILAVSGMAGDTKSTSPFPSAAHGFLSKPFKIEALLTAVYKLLHPSAEI